MPNLVVRYLVVCVTAEQFQEWVESHREEAGRWVSRGRTEHAVHVCHKESLMGYRGAEVVLWTHADKTDVMRNYTLEEIQAMVAR